MRVLATLILAAFVGVCACAGHAQVAEQHSCCDSHTTVSDWQACECCQVSPLAAPALLPAKASALVPPALPAAALSLADSLQPLLAPRLLADPFAGSSDRSPPKLYLRNASLLI